MLNKRALKTMEELFQKFGRKMSPHNVKQAYVPSGSTIIPNPIGTACGFSLVKSSTLFIFLPGVPREMKRMFEESVTPLIKKERPEISIVRSSVLKIFGKTESYCDQMLNDVIKSEEEIPKFAFNHPKLSRNYLYVKHLRFRDDLVEQLEWLFRITIVSLVLSFMDGRKCARWRFLNRKLFQNIMKVLKRK